MVTIAGDISFYCIPAGDGLLEGHVHPLSCRACSKPPVAVPTSVAVLFCSEKTQKLEWAHLPCLSKLKVGAETRKMALHPDVAESDVKVAVAGLCKCMMGAKPGAPDTAMTVPFRFKAAFRGPELKWKTVDASDCGDEKARQPISKSSGQDVPSASSGSEREAVEGVICGAAPPPPAASTKRALRVNTSDEVEPTPAHEAPCKAAVPHGSKKELKASSGSGNGSGSSRVRSTQRQDEDAPRGHIGEVEDDAQGHATDGVNKALASEPESAPELCEASTPKPSSERKELLLRAGA